MTILSNHWISGDHKCRAAEVVVITNGEQITLVRPINKLYPIESSLSTIVSNGQ